MVTTTSWSAGSASCPTHRTVSWLNFWTKAPSPTFGPATYGSSVNPLGGRSTQCLSQLSRHVNLGHVVGLVPASEAQCATKAACALVAHRNGGKRAGHFRGEDDGAA